MRIRLRETYELRRTPERARARLTIGFDGPVRAEVIARTSTALAGVIAGVEALPEGAVSKHRHEQLRVSSHRPWNNHGKQLAPVYTAAADLSVLFRDFEALAGWIEPVSERDGVRVEGVEWRLTRKSRERLERKARTRVVKAAEVKARQYAEAAGCDDVRAVTVADVGLLGEASEMGAPMPAPKMMRAALSAGAPDSSGPVNTFTPDKIRISASIEAEFEAS